MTAHRPRALPSFEEIRASAYAGIGDIQDSLRSDWLPGTATREQADELAEARRHLAAAKDALNRAT